MFRKSLKYRILPHAFGLGIFAILFASMPTTAYGQTGATAGGVYVDPSGVLRARSSSFVSKNLKARARQAKEGEEEALTFVSLPKLFAEVRTLLKAGKPIPAEMKYVGGLVRIQYVIADPENGDLFLAGPAEPIDQSDAERPTGKATGAPVLHLEDIVIALRTFGPGSKERFFGCSIDLTEGAIARLNEEAAKIGALKNGGANGPANRLAKAVGEQDVRIFGVPTTSRYALVALEADYIMKRLSLGLDKPKLKGFKSHLVMMQAGESMINRFWFVENYEPLLVSEDNSVFEIRGSSLKVNTSGSVTANTTASASANKFAEQMTTQFSELAELISAFADLRNLADLSVVSALIASDQLNVKCHWDLDWILTPGEFPLVERNVPKTAESLVNHKKSSKSYVITVGGVTINTREMVGPKNRVADANGKLKTIKKPTNRKSWSTVTSARAN